jgi:hypothetical protein
MSTPASGIEIDVQLRSVGACILHDCVSGKVETWTGENEADFRKNSAGGWDRRLAGHFVFDGWGHVLGG